VAAARITARREDQPQDGRCGARDDLVKPKFPTHSALIGIFGERGNPENEVTVKAGKLKKGKNLEETEPLRRKQLG
jgi:hypothetical protein